MNDDFDWGRILFVVVALGIGFLQWLWNLFQQNRQGRQAPDEEDLEYEDPEIRRMREEAWERQTRGASEPDPISRPPPVPAQPDPWGGLRELLEEAKAEVSPPPPPPPMPPTPAVQRRLETSPPPLTTSEPPATSVLSEKADQLSTQFANATRRSRKHRAGESDLGGLLVDDLRRPESLRRAIVIREVLGPPKALQSSSELLF